MKNFFLLFIGSGFMLAMEPPAIELQEARYLVSPGCYEAIRRINEDGRELGDFFEDLFKNISSQGYEDLKPSQVLARYLRNPNRELLNYQMQSLQYASAGFYLDYIMCPLIADLDKRFAALCHQYDEREAWYKFPEIFEEYGIRIPLKAYKYHLIMLDQHNDQPQLSLAPEPLIAQPHQQMSISMETVNAALQWQLPLTYNHHVSQS